MDLNLISSGRVPEMLLELFRRIVLRSAAAHPTLQRRTVAVLVNHTAEVCHATQALEVLQWVLPMALLLNSTLLQRAW
jgi:hypothetical protein